MYRVFRFQDIQEPFLSELIEIFDDNFFIYIHLVTLYQKISYEFMVKYERYITVDILIRNKKVSRHDIMLFNKYLSS